MLVLIAINVFFLRKSLYIVIKALVLDNHHFFSGCFGVIYSIKP